MSLHICAIFKNEAPYLKEWIEFHRIVGVEKFTLYQNNSVDDYHSVLDSYIAQGIVELIEWNIPVPSQSPAYADYITKHVGQEIWTAFIDIDEFLWSPKYDTVEEALSTLPRSAVGVNWVMMSYSGHEHYSPEPVIERFTKRPYAQDPASDLVNAHIKSIVWMGQGVGTAGNTHFFQTTHGMCNENGVLFDGPFSSHSSSILRINHYFTKSRDEWRIRAARGRADGIPREYDTIYIEDASLAVEDKEIQRFLPQLKERMKCQE